MQIPNDPKLNAMANRLDALTQWDAGHNDQVYLDKRKASTLRNAYYATQNCKWFVKLSLGGKQYILGITENGYSAARFADVCLVRFWPYRKRTRAILDSDVNFSLSQANSDMVEGSQCRQLIDAIENHLLAIGVISPVAEPAVSEAIPVPAAARKKLLHAHRAFDEAMREALSVLTQLSPEAATVVDMTTEHISQSQIYVGSVSQALNKL
jgi:hypothetical protein